MKEIKDWFNSDFILNGKTIKIRNDGYKHGYYFEKDGHEYTADSFYGFEINEKNSIKDDVIKTVIEIKAINDIEADSIFVRTGIDCYMEKYPDWNDIFFPTFLRSEETHFTGYLMTPNGDILSLASPDKIEAWSLDYNRAQYGEEDHVGHRIYTFCLHFINRSKDVYNGKSNFKLKAGEKLSYTIYWKIQKNLDEVSAFFSKYTLAPVIESSKWTYEQGELIDVKSDGDLHIIGPDGKSVDNKKPIMVCGLYKIKSKKKNKISSAYIYVRETLDKYLEFAARCAFRYPQRPSTHAETYYGYFSAFYYAYYSKDENFVKKTEEDFNNFLSVMINSEGDNLVEDALPERIQNLSTLISLLVVAYKATSKKEYLNKAVIFACTLMKEQAEGGEYLGWGHTHYTCVIYPAKSMLELYEVLNEVNGFEKDRDSIYSSARRAIIDLSKRLDDIQTEGQQTFEDGMIACAALQLGYMAYQNEEQREHFTSCAEILMNKHKCLEQNLVPDARMRGATLRFWESMYDVLINKNMINSPHGWTSWKTYATFYLYLLTHNVKYLKDTFDTLGACLQCFDIKNDQLYWAFIADPVIKADIFSYNGKCTLTPSVFGNCHLPMISDRWLSDRNKVCYGYAFVHEGQTDGKYKGGCCDNDVHEHIKCMEEAGLNAFIHETSDNDFLSYNCNFAEGKIILKSKFLKKLYFYSLKNRNIMFNEKMYALTEGMNVIKI